MEKSDIRIPVNVGGITFKNPFYVASGPTTKSVRQLMRIEETGWAAASIKLSIDPAPYINRKPRYSLFRDRDALAFTAEKRLTFEQGLKLIADAKPKLRELLLMANITYAGDDGAAGWVNMARRFEEAGADIIELNMCCPNMSYNLELTSGGSSCSAKQTGASMGRNADVAAEIVSAIKGSISIPLFVKLTPEGGQIARVAKSLYEAGADAVGGTGNRLGMPPIDISDPGKAFYHLQKEISLGCHCGKWLKPLAQRDTYEIRKVCGMEAPVTATGGIANWRDAVEMLLCGGTLLGVCAETLISGYDIVRPMIAGLDAYMREQGYENLDQMRGLVVPQVRTAADVTLYDGYAAITDPKLSAPCKSACPLHLPTQAYAQKIAKGDFRAAYDLITGQHDLQELCGLVCAHPCEDACLRGGYDAPVKLRALKHFVLEYGKARGWEPKWNREPNGRRVAVAGAGACGLSCALALNRAGYDVTVFEAEEELGGALRFGLPAYAGQRQALIDTAARMRTAGVRFVFGKRVGADVSLAELREQGFERVFAALGATGREQSVIPGAEHAKDVRAFLARLNHNETLTAAEEVAVIGSGYAATHAARSLARLGARKVTLLSPAKLGRREAERENLRLMAEEGIAVLDGVQVQSICVEGVRFLRDGAPLELSCGEVFLEHTCRPEELSDGTDFVVYPERRGAELASAIAAGKLGAAEIDRALCGEKALVTPIAQLKTVNPEIVRRRVGYLKKDRNPLRLTEEASVRLAGFAPETRAMSEEEAVREAARCLNCGCGEGCQLCKTICTDFAPEIVAQDELQINRKECVACGMCFNRCPIGNIEMVNSGQTV